MALSMPSMVIPNTKAFPQQSHLGLLRKKPCYVSYAVYVVRLLWKKVR